MGFRSSKRIATGRAQLVAEGNRVSAGGTADAGRSTQLVALHNVFRLRVLPDDGSPEFDSTLSTWGDVETRNLEVGHWTYVLYDATSPTKCEIDKDRLEREFGRLYSGKARLVVPRDTSGAWGAAAARSR
jgi:hypothetical protein